MSQSTDEQITQLLSTLKKSIQSRSKKVEDSDSELEYEVNDVTEVEDIRPGNSACGRRRDDKGAQLPIVKQKKNIPEEPVGTVSHQKFCIRCGSADNLFRNNKYKTCVVCCSKTNRPPQSDKQREAFQRCKAKRLENVQQRKNALKEFEEKIKDEMDSKIVKKAIAVKKRSIIREAQLDEISDDDTPLEEVMEVAKKTETKKRAPRKVKNPEQPNSAWGRSNEEKIEKKEIEPQELQQQYYIPQISFA